MRKVVIIVTGIALLAAAATYIRYENFDPCDWMAQDRAENSKLPLVVLRAQIRAEFLVRGITEPDPTDCVLAWWESRAEEATQ